MRAVLRWGVAGLVAGIALAAFRADLSWPDGTAPAEVSAFTLVTHEGAPFGPADLRGAHALVYFGYTSCPDVCPLGLYTIRGVLRELGTAGEGVRAYFVTLDPRRDSREVMAAYVAAFHPRIVGLTGRDEEIDKLARYFGVTYAVPRKAGSYAVDHSTYTYLVTPSGTVARAFPHGVEPARMAAVVRGVLEDAEG